MGMDANREAELAKTEAIRELILPKLQEMKIELIAKADKLVEKPGSTAMIAKNAGQRKAIREIEEWLDTLAKRET